MNRAVRSMSAVRALLSAKTRAGAKVPLQGGRSNRFITISRQAGAGGTTVAEHLARLLDEEEGAEREACWTVFDRNLLERVLADHDLPREFSDLLREEAPPELQRMIVASDKPTPRSLVVKTSETIHRLAALGHAIVIGRAAALVTRAIPGGRHVRLVGSSERRRQRLAQHLGVGPEEAAQVMRERDEGRRRYLHRYFSAEIDDPLLYDLILNTDHLECEQAARVIAAAAGLVGDGGRA